MGFRDDIDAIAKFLAPPPRRQTFLFSATLSERIRQIAAAQLSSSHHFLDASTPASNTPPNPSTSTSAHVPWAASSDTELTTHPHISQYHTSLPSVDAQIPTLLRLIAHDQLVHGSESKIMVFCPTTHSTAFFAALLHQVIAHDTLPSMHTRIIEIHSKLTQTVRQRASDDFRGVQPTKPKSKFGKTKAQSVLKHPTILVTSDVSARGVDYPNVTRVIQLGIPSSEALYVHRIGRTGRGASTLNLPTPAVSTAPTVDSATRPMEEHNTEISAFGTRHRADLLLLPWESGYPTWRLAQFPVKALTTAALESQVASLASASSCAFPHAVEMYKTCLTAESKDAVTAGNSIETSTLTDAKTIHKNEKDGGSKFRDPLSTVVASILSRMDKEAVRQAAASFLGHYLPLAGPLRVRANTILEGIAAWSRFAGVEMGMCVLPLRLFFLFYSSCACADENWNDLSVLRQTK